MTSLEVSTLSFKFTGIERSSAIDFVSRPSCEGEELDRILFERPVERGLSLECVRLKSLPVIGFESDSLSFKSILLPRDVIPVERDISVIDSAP